MAFVRLPSVHLRRPATAVLAGALVAPLLIALPAAPGAAAQTAVEDAQIATSPARFASPVVLTGDQLPGWFSSAATGQPAPYPFGVQQFQGERSAHNGEIVVPPDAGTGVAVDELAAYRWAGGRWTEIPFQVDEQFIHHLANGRSDFSFYSGTDTELTYAWGGSANTVGQEAWKKVFGECEARYALTEAEVQAALDADAIGALPAIGPQTALDSYFGPMADPVPGLDADDELVFMASDAGAQAPLGQPGPAGTIEDLTARQEVRVTDPVTGSVSYAYIFRQADGPSFDETNGYVDLRRDADADEWIDRNFFPDGDPEELGTSNSGYGANLVGTVCDGTDAATRVSNDRFPRDGQVVSTDSYRVTATGRWMLRAIEIAAEGQAAQVPGADHSQRATTYGPDLLDRWKGRAFQQSPDSQASVVGFEDEQVNWEGNAALLGWKAGPVRAIREIWGADSGTNVTKVETYYREAVTHRYRVRVHPIPADGLYTSWDYNPEAVVTYFNTLRPDGVPIDGIDDEQVGNIDGLDYDQDGNVDFRAYFDVPDPTFDIPSPIERWEQVAGREGNGSLVYITEINNLFSQAQNPLVVPYYRDDACLDDGTGDGPVQRPRPGDEFASDGVKNGYVDFWRAETGDQTLVYEDLICDPGADPATTPLHQRMPFQGAIAQHGLHFFFTHDTDNAFVGSPTAINEIDATQWQFMVPQTSPENVGAEYGLNVQSPLVAVAIPQANVAQVPSVPMAGAASVDATWHVGSAAGQHADVPVGGSSGVHPGSTGEEGTDPFGHASAKTASYGIESRDTVRAMVLQGADGSGRWAVVSNDLYLSQDLLVTRVGQLLAEHDDANPGSATGISTDNLTVSSSHSHTSPYYSTTSAGVFVFQDVFDIRHFEFMARAMADAVIAAADDMTPATLAVGETRFRGVADNVQGPANSASTSTSDGAPGGYPRYDIDDRLQVVVVDDADTGDAIARWVIFGMHPELLDGSDLLSGEYVNQAETLLDRELGGVTVWSQTAVGSSESRNGAASHPSEQRQEFYHREFAQMQRAARQFANAVLGVVTELDALDGGADPATLTHLSDWVTAPDGGIVDESFIVSGVDLRFAPPSARLYPSVGNCRTSEAAEGNPGIPAGGLPDCGYYVPAEFGENLPFNPGIAYSTLIDAGVPVPDNYAAPSYSAVQESLTVHLQAIRLGEYGVTVHPAETFVDETRNVRSRLDEVADNTWFGFDWTANYRENAAQPGSTPVGFEQPGDFTDTNPFLPWNAGVRYDGRTDDAGDLLPGHGPYTLNDFCIPLDGAGAEIPLASDRMPVATPTTWSCKNPANQAQRIPITHQLFLVNKARIYNDAAGWDLPENAPFAESEPSDPEQIWGNWTDEEIQDLLPGRGDAAFDMVGTIGMTNDYWGYLVPYAEFQGGDSYRKALGGLGPHGAEFMATRLTRMLALTRGVITLPTGTAASGDDLLTAKDRSFAFEAAQQQERARLIGEASTNHVTVYESNPANVPSDGGAPTITVEPTAITRYDAAQVTWVGGSNFTDTPHARVERCTADDGAGSCTGTWEPFGDGFGEVKVKVNFPKSEDEIALQRLGQFTWEWEAEFEAATLISEPVGGADRPSPTTEGWTWADGVRREQVPAGLYQFVLSGCHRGLPGSSAGSGDCNTSDQTQRVAPYELTSAPFSVTPWDGITVEQLDVDLDTGEVSFLVGPEFPYPTSYTAHEVADGVPYLDYPNSFDSTFATRTTGDDPAGFISSRDDAACIDGGCDDLRTYPNGSVGGSFAGGPELFCFTCTFRPWAEIGTLTSATSSVAITVAPLSGTPRTVDAAWDAATGRFVAPAGTLDGGDEIFVAAGQIVDDLGETNLRSVSQFVPLLEADDLSGLEGDTFVVDDTSVRVVASSSDATLSYVFDAGDGSDPVTSEVLDFSHVYADDGPFSASITVDGIRDGGAGETAMTATFSVAVANVAPVLNPVADRSVAADEPVTFVAAFTDVGVQDTHDVTWVFDLSDPTNTTATGVETTHSYACSDPSCAFDARVTVLDDDGGSDTTDFVVTATNGVPTGVDAGGPYTSLEGGSLGLTGTATSPVLTWAWDFGDGTTGLGQNPDHVYAEDGSYTATLTATGPGGPSTAQALVTVTNVAPDVAELGDVTTDESFTEIFTATVTDPGADDSNPTIVWFLDDVQVASDADSYTRRFPDGPATHVLRVLVTDSDGATDEAISNITVRNRAPALGLTGATETVEGRLVRYDADASDLGEDELTIAWAVDGVTQDVTGPVFEHAFPDDGTYAVTATVTDDDGDSNTDTIETVVANVAPSVGIDGPGGADEYSDPIRLRAIFDDPGVDDTHTYQWTLAGEPITGATAASLVINIQDGPKRLDYGVVVTDDDGGSGSTGHPVLVANVAPTPEVSGPTTFERGSSATYTVTWTDPAGSVDAPYTVEWRVDGRVIDGETATSFVYTTDQAGHHDITAGVVDKDGGGNLDTVTVSVTVPVDGGDGEGEPPVTPKVNRSGGAGRIDTANLVVETAWDAASTVLIARSDEYPDAIAAAPLAAKLGAPVLLSTPTTLPASTAAQIRRLGATNAILLGGTQALAADIEAQLRDQTDVTDVRRIFGENRHGTATAIAAEVGGTSVFLVRGTGTSGFADALAVGGLAAARGFGIVLATPDRLPAETKLYLDGAEITDIVVVGGPAAVSDEVAQEAKGDARTLRRIAGSTRYATSLLLAGEALDAGLRPAVTWFATGENWPDALVAGPAITRLGGVLLLVNGRTGSDGNHRTWLDAHDGEVVDARILGGVEAVNATIEQEIRDRVLGT